MFSISECKNGLAIYTPQYFSGLRDNVGVYMWMTGESVRGEDCVRFGLADYFVPSNTLSSLESELFD